MEKTIRIEPPQECEDFDHEVKTKLDEFLDVYSLYRQTRICWVRDMARMKAYELHLLNPAFNFQC